MSRTKKEYRTCSKENYHRFLTQNNIKESELSYSKYSKNLNTCNWMWVEYALSTGSKVILPFGFGGLAVNKKMFKRFKEFKDKDGNTKKVINLRINWKKTKELKKVIYHTNEHTDGFNYRWIWFARDSKLYLADLYVFKPGRYASRAIKKYLTKPNSQYKQLYHEWLI